jgi:hypothetical protein
MPALKYEFTKQIQEDIGTYKTFVETGTYHCETILNMEPFFDMLYTIEIQPSFYVNAKQKYGSKNKIQFLLGDSSKIMNGLCPMLQTNTMFFLDGHWSCGNTGKGDKDVPLYEELTHIYNYLKHKGIIIIDDVRLFNTNHDVDWSSINVDTCIKILGNRVEKHYYLPSELHAEDRLIIHIRELQ